ncbi:MAG: hypothetical protein ACTSQ8_25785 [Candidatus Helarchaeota archaeon]
MRRIVVEIPDVFAKRMDGCLEIDWTEICGKHLERNVNQGDMFVSGWAGV